MFTVKVNTYDQTYKLEYDDTVVADQVLKDVGIVLPKPCNGSGTCGKCKILLNGESALACKTKISSDSIIDYTIKTPFVQGLTFGRSCDLSINPIVEQGFGAAIDIGTTTVAGYIYQFPSATLIKSICLPNLQTAYGADVISRIDYFSENGKEELKNAIIKVINEIANGFKIEKFVICGNTAMLHFLTGDDPSSLAVAPYKSNKLFGEWLENRYIVRCIGAFVGADITAVMLASGIEKNNTALLVDIGTNGEMVLKHNDKLLCCATAAGPCFEGAGIACGITACAGAINSVFVEDGEIQFTTIDHAKPIGICGTGLIDAIASLLEVGLIDESGYMETDYYFADSDIFISPSDVRSFQLAKSAIRSGLETLIHFANIEYSKIETFYISGGFGYFLNIDNAVKVGLIPKALSKKVTAIGNGAGMGASMMLLSKERLEHSVEIAKKTEIVDLNVQGFFAQSYFEHMSF